MARGVSSAMQLARLVTCSSDNGGHGEADRRSSHPPGNSGDRELGLQWAPEETPLTFPWPAPAIIARGGAQNLFPIPSCTKAAALIRASLQG